MKASRATDGKHISRHWCRCTYINGEILFTEDVPSEYRNPRTIHQHNQDQQRSIQCRRTAWRTQNNQQAETTAPNHYHDNPSPFVPFYKAQCCIFSSPSSLFREYVLLVNHLQLWAPLLVFTELGVIAAKSSRTPPRWTCSADQGIWVYLEKFYHHW